MGLDMYAYAVACNGTVEESKLQTILQDGDFDELQKSKFHQWRKHPNLHGFMQKIYTDEYDGDFASTTLHCELRSAN